MKFSMLRLFYYTLLIGFIYPSISYSAAQESAYYILYRGFHFPPSQAVPTAEAINAVSGEDCKAFYTSSRDLTPEQIASQAAKLMTLKNTGPVTVGDKTFSSCYDAFQEQYVCNYRQMFEDLKNPSSNARKWLEAAGLECDEIFLLSTSLNPYTALKFAAGITMPKARKRKPVLTSLSDGQIQCEPTLLGYLDIFAIPAATFQALHPYFVLENFTLHEITLPYRFHAKNYTTAEEVNIPFLIPGRFHYRRIPVFMPGGRYPSEKKLGENFQRSLRTLIAPYIDMEVESVMTAKRFQRQYLSPYATCFIKRSLHLVPTMAVEIKDRIQSKIDEISFKFFNPRDNSFNIDEITIDPYVACALAYIGRHNPVALTTQFRLDRDNIAYLVPIIRAPKLKSITLEGDPYGIDCSAELAFNRKLICEPLRQSLERRGALKDLDDTFEPLDLVEAIKFNQQNEIRPSNDLRAFPWRRPSNLNMLLHALWGRSERLDVYLDGQSLDEESYSQLVDFQGDIRIEDRRRYDDLEEARRFYQLTFRGITDEEYYSNLHREILEDAEEKEEEQFEGGLMGSFMKEDNENMGGYDDEETPPPAIAGNKRRRGM